MEEYVWTTEMLDAACERKEIVVFCVKCTSTCRGRADHVVESRWFDLEVGSCMCPTCGPEWAKGLICTEVSDMEVFMRKLNGHIVELHTEAFMTDDVGVA